MHIKIINIKISHELAYHYINRAVAEAGARAVALLCFKITPYTFVRQYGTVSK